MEFLNNIFYMYSNMDSSSQILLFLIVLVLLMLISIGVINTIIKKKNEKYDRKFNPIDRYTTMVNKKEKKIDKQEIKIEVPKKEEEIEKLEELEVVEVVSSDNSLEKISELLEDNMNNKNDSINLTKYEEEEEKDAIISYDELVKRAGAKKIVYKTETPKKEEKKEKIQEVKQKDNNREKFKASLVISPIYGVQKQKEEKKDELEEFIDLEDIPFKNENVKEDVEVQNDMNFLSNLKAFRSNLD